MTELGYHHFVTPNELLDLGNHHQWLLTSQKEQRLALMHFLVELHTTFYNILDKK